MKSRYVNDPPIHKKKLKGVAWKAYTSFKGQKERTGVEYTFWEFLDWYKKEYSKKDKWGRVHVARFDHSKKYSFDNIVMQEDSENVKERNIRRGNPSLHRKRPVIAKCVSGKNFYFDSCTAAANFFLIDPSMVVSSCTGKNKGTRHYQSRSAYHRNLKPRFSYA